MKYVSFIPTNLIAYIDAYLCLSFCCFSLFLISSFFLELLSCDSLFVFMRCMCALIAVFFVCLLRFILFLYPSSPTTLLGYQRVYMHMCVYRRINMSIRQFMRTGCNVPSCVKTRIDTNEHTCIYTCAQRNVPRCFTSSTTLLLLLKGVEGILL